MPIRLYWNGGDRRETNFGDRLSPLLVESLSHRPVAYAYPEACDLVAGGSVLETVAAAYRKRLLRLRLTPVDVWGSGAQYPEWMTPSAGLRLRAVRGRLTRQALCLPDSLPVGDPTLLVERLELAPHAAPSVRWGILPHVVDRTNCEIRALAARTPSCRMIDPCQEDPRRALAEIRGCAFVASTSLHGLIAADALGIPNVWLRASDWILGGTGKFRDYFSAVGRTEQAPLDLRVQAVDLAACERSAVRVDRACLAARQHDLEQAFRAMNL